MMSDWLYWVPTPPQGIDRDMWDTMHIAFWPPYTLIAWRRWNSVRKKELLYLLRVAHHPIHEIRKLHKQMRVKPTCLDCGKTHNSDYNYDLCHQTKTFHYKLNDIKSINYDITGTREEFGEEYKHLLGYWQSIVFQIIKRDGEKCQIIGCNINKGLEVHHIIPRCEGGSDHPRNLITLCQKHHQHTFGNKYRIASAQAQSKLLVEVYKST